MPYSDDDEMHIFQLKSDANPTKVMSSLVHQTVYMNSVDGQAFYVGKEGFFKEKR